MAYYPKNDLELGLSLGAFSQLCFSLGKRIVASATFDHENDLATCRRDELIIEEKREMPEQTVTMPKTGNDALDTMMAAMMAFVTQAQAAQAPQAVKPNALNNVSATVEDNALVLRVALDVTPIGDGYICKTQGTSASSGDAVRTIILDGLTPRDDGKVLACTLTVFYTAPDSIRPYAKTSAYWGKPRGTRKPQAASAKTA